jgi:hypothetical protein
MQPEAKALRWKEYFVNHLNCEILDCPIPHTEYQKAESHIKNLSLKLKSKKEVSRPR